MQLPPATHHLLKTFWTGDWELTLLSDGAAVWTSPTGVASTKVVYESDLIGGTGVS